MLEAEHCCAHQMQPIINCCVFAHAHEVSMPACVSIQTRMQTRSQAVAGIADRTVSQQTIY